MLQRRLTKHHRLRLPRTVLSIAIVLLCGACIAPADTLTDNLTNSTIGTEAASGNTWLSASFTTGVSSASLGAATLLLSNPIPGTAELDLYSDAILQPDQLVGVFASPASYTTSRSATTFSSPGFTLKANATYWVVLEAPVGEYDWAWTADNTGTGSGFTGVWGLSPDAGATWFTSNVYPTQLSITTDELSTATPEPNSSFLAITGFILALASINKRKLYAGKKDQ